MCGAIVGTLLTDEEAKKEIKKLRIAQCGIIYLLEIKSTAYGKEEELKELDKEISEIIKTILRYK